MPKKIEKEPHPLDDSLDLMAIVERRGVSWVVQQLASVLQILEKDAPRKIDK